MAALRCLAAVAAVPLDHRPPHPWAEKGLASTKSPPTAAPALRPAAVRNLEELLQNWRHFSTGGREPADKAESLLRTWWKRARDRVENADSVDKDKAVFAYGVVVIGTPTLYLLNWTRKWF